MDRPIVSVCECGQAATRFCVQCRLPICADCAVYRGESVPPEKEWAKCPHCDYLDFLNTHGG